MATITEEMLRGDWFHLEEEGLLNRTAESFYTLSGGRVTWGPLGEVVGSYAIDIDRAVVTFLTASPTSVTIVLRSIGEAESDTPDWIQADATYEMTDGSEPLYVYGSFVRRIAGFPSIHDILRHADDRKDDASIVDSEPNTK